MSTTATLLYVDDEPANLDLFSLEFGDRFRVLTAGNAAEGLTILEENEIDILLSDERMPGMSGVEFLALAWERWPDVGRFIVSAYSDADRILRAINFGHAHEYILKPWDPNQILASLERRLDSQQQRKSLIRKAHILEELSATPTSSDESLPVGLHSGMQHIAKDLKAISKSSATVLIQGETGTGKELFASAIHQESPRSTKPILRVNCSALSEPLLQSELFGHEKGAFTGADRLKRGRFELAHEGTIFLDEIGDISPQMQVSLLRVLQEGTFERVGGTRSIQVDVRVIAATHRDLPGMVAKGEFREDLFYRLNVLPLHLPPLRARLSDIPALVKHFIKKHGRKGAPQHIPAETMHALQAYSWPGNIRELENMIQRALIINQSGVLEPSDFQFELVQREKNTQPTKRDYQNAMVDELRKALLCNHGNCSRAARALNLPRSTFVSRAQKFGLIERKRASYERMRTSPR